MEIKKLILGPIEENCYIVSEGSDAFLIDPGDESEKIIKELGDLNLRAIILTHLHFDHIIAVKSIKVNTGAKIYCHKKDLEILDEKLLKKDDIDGFLEDEFIFSNLRFQVLHTPGHTPGGVCLYNPEQNTLFSGDTIFAGSVGVTHFKGGDAQKLKDSVEMLLKLPDETLVYPGHGEEFRLGDYKDEIEKVLNLIF